MGGVGGARHGSHHLLPSIHPSINVMSLSFLPILTLFFFLFSFPSLQFWHEEIAALQSKHEGAFDVTRILSQEDKDKPGFLPRGRIDAQVLSQVFGHWKKKKKEEEGNVASGDSVVARFLTVGTKPMMRQAEKNLAIAGFPWPQSALLSKPS